MPTPTRSVGETVSSPRAQPSEPSETRPKSSLITRGRELQVRGSPVRPYDALPQGSEEEAPELSRR